VSEKHGFLIEKPVIKLPEKFAQWEDIGRRLVPLLAENKFRDTIDNELPLIGRTSWKRTVGTYPKNNPIFSVRNFDQKSKFWQKIEILTRNRSFVQKSKFWSTIEILTKIEIFTINLNFDQKSKFWWKVEILTRTRTFVQKSKFWSKIEIFTKNFNFDCFNWQLH